MMPAAKERDLSLNNTNIYGSLLTTPYFVTKRPSSFLLGLTIRGFARINNGVIPLFLFDLDIRADGAYSMRQPPVFSQNCIQHDLRGNEMKKILIGLMLTVASLLLACGDQGMNKAANSSVNNANSNSAAPVNTAAIEGDIKKLVADYAAGMAKNDVAAWDKITNDNFMFVSNDGSVQTKAERLASMKSGETKYESLTYDDLNVRVKPEGDAALVIGKATVKGMNMGKPIDGVNRVTQVWGKTKDGWKLISLQATAITAKDDKKVDEKKADDKTKPANTKADANKASAPANK